MPQHNQTRITTLCLFPYWQLQQWVRQYYRIKEPRKICKSVGERSPDDHDPEGIGKNIGAEQ